MLVDKIIYDNELPEGFKIIHALVADDLIGRLLNEMQQYNLSHELKAGIRNAQGKLPTINKIIRSDNVQHLVKTHLGEKAQLVRAIVFDKSKDNNWLVPWHQDKTVAVSQKMSLEGWGPWTTKEGVHHTQVPEAVLNSMLTIRLHLDKADVSNGCLKVIPKSHCSGVLTQKAITAVAANVERWVYCVAQKGDALIMRPHLLHASSKSAQPGKRRRILHLEFSSFELPCGVCWA